MTEEKKKTKKSGKTKIDWRNRIVATGEKAAKEFKYNPLNWRQHNDFQRSAMDGVLSEIGWVQGVIENVRTGNLIDGHLRVEEAMKLGEETIVPFVQVDLSEEEEKKILLVLDPIGALATMDAENFLELADSVDLHSDALQELIAEMSKDQTTESDNEPNLNDPDFNYENQFGVIVECDGEDHQKEVFDSLTAQGFKVKVVVV